MVSLILGVGGTGAKIVESFVHLCGAGLGPSKAGVAFIDQDKSNGNTLRARAALTKYAGAHKALREAAGVSSELECALLSTKLDPFPDQNDIDNCHWVPQSQSDVDLASLINYSLMRDESSKGFARSLFLYDDELRMQLNEGYRGRPHVGSAALLIQLGKDEFWQSLEDLVQSSGEEVRVFLCGSAFGGTGAAILPTLARRLRQVAVEASRPLRTGGILMLPYFTFAPPDDREANVAAGHELVLQSQAALQHYHAEMQIGGRPYSFDDLYFVGWNPAIPLTYHAAGAAHQVNPPLAPELFAALAAARFFAEQREVVRGGGGDDDPALHLISRAGRGLVWDDLPEVPGSAPTDAAYATWLRFCALWHFNFAKAFGPERPEAADQEAWFRNQVGSFEADTTLDAIGDYVSAALRYAAGMAAFSTWGEKSNKASFDLWTAEILANVEFGDPRSVPNLEGGTLADGMGDFSALVRGLEHLPSAADVYWALSEKPSPRSRGLWPLIAQLHACSGP